MKLAFLSFCNSVILPVTGVGDFFFSLLGAQEDNRNSSTAERASTDGMLFASVSQIKLSFSINN